MLVGAKEDAHSLETGRFRPLKSRTFGPISTLGQTNFMSNVTFAKGTRNRARISSRFTCPLPGKIHISARARCPGGFLQHARAADPGPERRLLTPRLIGPAPDPPAVSFWPGPFQNENSQCSRPPVHFVCRLTCVLNTSHTCASRTSRPSEPPGSSPKSRAQPPFMGPSRLARVP